MSLFSKKEKIKAEKVYVTVAAPLCDKYQTHIELQGPEQYTIYTKKTTNGDTALNLSIAGNSFCEFVKKHINDVEISLILDEEPKLEFYLLKCEIENVEKTYQEASKFMEDLLKTLESNKKPPLKLV